MCCSMTLTTPSANTFIRKSNWMFYLSNKCYLNQFESNTRTYQPIAFCFVCLCGRHIERKQKSSQSEPTNRGRQRERERIRKTSTILYIFFPHDFYFFVLFYAPFSMLDDLYILLSPSPSSQSFSHMILCLLCVCCRYYCCFCIIEMVV